VKRGSTACLLLFHTAVVVAQAISFNFAYEFSTPPAIEAGKQGKRGWERGFEAPAGKDFHSIHSKVPLQTTQRLAR